MRAGQDLDVLARAFHRASEASWRWRPLTNFAMIPYLGLNRNANRNSNPKVSTMQGPEGRFNQYEARRPIVDPEHPRTPPSQNIVGNESEKR